MAKRLSAMTWDEVQKEMSIAGSPEKIAALGKEIMDKISQVANPTNRAELTNIEFALQRVIGEVKLMQRMYDKSHNKQ